MSVHYKFKSALDFDTITFDGLHISVADLKKAIIHQKRLGKTMDFDLQITNAQTKEEYGDDSVLIPKNTSLTIARVPLKNAPKKNWEPKRSRDQDQDNQSGQGSGSATAAASRKGQDAAAMQSNVDLSTMNGTEEDKIREMMFQSTAEYDPTNYQRIRGQSQTGEVPINYKCYRCHKPGHWIKNCPLGPLPKEAMEVVKRTSGIPRSFIERDKDPENNPIIQLPQVVPEEKQVIPEDLICAICKDLFTDAVMIPCCGSSFCDECVRTALLESEDNECPDCKEKGSSPGSLIPNRFLRNSVNAFRNETGYTKAPPKVNNKQTKPVEEPAAAEQTAVSSSTNITETSHGEADAEEKHSKEHTEEGQQESTDHCDLHESYEEVSQHGDIGSPNGEDKAFDNDSDYEDGITVTVPPAHVQSRGASRLHYNGRSSHYPRHETPPTGGGYEYSREPYNSGTSSSGGSRSERPEVNHEEGSGESRPSKPEDKEGNYNAAPSGAPKHEYGSRSPDYHQPSRGLIPLPTRGHPQQHPPMGGMPPHSGGYMGAPHQGPPGPGYPGAPHPAAPHPYPGGYGMQPGYPPQRPYDHPGGGMYHGERPPRMMYPPRGGYAPHPPHMRPRHMAPMGPGGYPGVPHVGTGVIDDPLEAFNRIMREKERRKEQEAAKQASRHRSSPHGDRSRRSRSFDNDGGKRSSRRSADRERRRSPRRSSPERRRSPEEKHGGGEREGGGRRRRNRSSSYSSGSRSYSRSPAKRGKSPKRRSSRSPQYRERRSRSRSKSFEERRHSKHSKDRSRDERRDEHRGDYREHRDRSPGYGSHYSGYRGRGGYRGGMRGRGGRGDGGGYYRGYGGDRGHMPPQGPLPDQYGHPMGPGPDYHHHDPSMVPQHHHGVVPPMAAGGPGGHYAAPPQQAMATGGAGGGGGGGPIPSRFPPRDGRDPYMGHGPVKTDPSMGYGYEDPSRQQIPMQQQQLPPVQQQQQQQPVPSAEPPPPGFEEQDTWSGKQESAYPANVTAVKAAEEGGGAGSYEYHNTPKSRDHERAHTPVIRDEMEGGSSSGKKKSRDDGREERRGGRSKTPDRHDKSKRGDREDREKKRGEVSKDKRVGGEKERHRESEKDREAKRKQRDSSEEEKRDKKKDKEKKKRKKEKEAEKKKHKKERKEKDKDKRSKEGKKERKTVEKEEADSSLQPATPKHAPRKEEGDQEKEQQQVDTTQEYMAHELDDTLVIPERCHDLSKTASEAEDNSYREEPSSSHDQQEEQQHQQDQLDLGQDHSDLYSDIPEKYEGDQLEKSVLEGHLGEEEDADLVNSSGVAVEDHDEIKRSDSILDLHANLDFEAELEEGEHQSPPKFISIPELSKWELDEDTPIISSSDRKADDHGSKHEDTSNKVTNEVLKRAENAIFTRAINAIRPIEIKKISVDRQKLYSNESQSDADVVEIKNDKHDKQQDELKRFQITVPTSDDHAERSVEIKDSGSSKLDISGTGRSSSPVRGSIKERLGSKITDRSGTFSRSRTPPQGSRASKVKSSSSSSKLVVESAASSSSRKRSRSKSTERDGSRGGGRSRGQEDRGRRGEEIKISSSSSGGSRRVDIGRRLVVQVREVTPDKRRVEGERKGERRSRERVLKEATSSGDRSRDRMVRRGASRERSREKRMDRDREREKDRKRGEGKDRGDPRRKSPAEKSGSHGYKDDKKSLERKPPRGESERRRRERSPSPAVRHSKEEDPGQRFVEALGRVVQEVVPTKKSKAEKSLAKSKPTAASSSDSSSSDSESSSSDSSSDSDDESTRKRKKRKHKKDRKRAKRSASTESDDSGGKKKKKSKKSKSGKKKKKEKKHRKGE